MSKVQLYQGDCLDIMKNIPDKSIDAIIADLPFQMTQNKWDRLIPFEPLWENYNRIIKDNGAIVLFCMMPFTAELVHSNLKNFKYMWTWYKHYTRNFLNAKKQPLRTTENIAVFYKSQCTYNPQMRKGKLMEKGRSRSQSSCYGTFGTTSNKNDIYYPTDILDFVGVPTNESLHPTQKPVELLEYLIKTYTDRGGIVLDNCCGSGSTGVAACNTDRAFIGIELDEKYFQIAKERIEKAVEKHDE